MCLNLSLIKWMCFGALINNVLTVTWKVDYHTEKLQLQMDTISTAYCSIKDLNYGDIMKNDKTLTIKSDLNTNILVDHIINKEEITYDGKWNGSFQIEAIFLGRANIYVEIIDLNNLTEVSDQILPVVVVRKDRVIDHIFTGSIIVLVSVLYINFGAALDILKLKAIIIRPTGPLIGFFCQFLFMPLTSYILGLIVFPDEYEMQLGLFFTGVSPGGGASNMWTIILGGNMDLSITMTAISNIAAFGMMPLWLFTLGKTIFDKGDIQVPYRKLTTFVLGLIIPLTIGLLIQRFLPKFARFLSRILKTLSALLIIFIVIFAIVTNLYLFKLLKWRICVAGLLLPWLGYSFSWIVAKSLRKNAADALAIAIETGVQNTGIAIFVLRLSLEQPDADMTTVIPVAVAIMTPIPLLMLYLVQCFRRRINLEEIQRSDTVEKNLVSNGNDDSK